MNYFMLLWNSVFRIWFPGQSNGPIWGSLFHQPSSKQQLSSSRSLRAPNFLLEGAPLCWRHSNINTPSLQSTFHLPAWPSLSRCHLLPDFFSRPLCAFHFHSHLSPTCEDLPFAPFVSHLHFLGWKFPSTVSLLWSLTEHIFTPRYPQSHFPFAAFLFTLNYSWIWLNLITLQALSFFFDRGFNVNSHQRNTWWRETEPSCDSPPRLFYHVISMLIKWVMEI